MKHVQLSITRREDNTWDCFARVGGTFFDKALTGQQASNILFAYDIEMPQGNGYWSKTLIDAVL